MNRAYDEVNEFPAWTLAGTSLCSYFNGCSLVAHADGRWVCRNHDRTVTSEMQTRGKDLREAKQRALCVAINWPR